MSMVVLVYSKHSVHAMNLLHTMEGVLEFRKLSIDHPDVRHRLATHNRFGIHVVPCILVMYSNGSIQKYEGQDAYTWVHSTLQKMQRLSEPMTRSTPDRSTIVLGPSPPSSDTMMTSKSSSDISTSSSDFGTVFHPPSDPQPQETTVHVDDNKPLSLSHPDETSANDSMASKSIKGIKRSTQDNKNDSLQSIAAQLQAERDRNDEFQYPQASKLAQGRSMPPADVQLQPSTTETTDTNSTSAVTTH